MRPRTKQQLKFYNLSRSLMGITKSQEEWAIANCLRHVAYQTKKTTYCLDCGHEWPTQGCEKYCDCPECGRKLKVEVTRKKKLEQREFLAVLNVVDDIQVVRLFEIRSHHKAGRKMQLTFWEVVHQFFDETRLFEVVARQRNLHWNMDSFSGDFTVRDKHQFDHKYDLSPTKILPGARVLPIFRRNGFRSSSHGLTVYELFQAIVNDSKSETLLKTRQTDLLRANVAASRGYLVNRHWDSIKICIRNRYIVKDAKIWLDYMDLLAFYRRDLRSPKYVCPVDLKKAHDRLVAKKRAEEKRREIAKMRLFLEKEQAAYERSKQAFFGIRFNLGSISVKVLEHVREFMEEGDLHNHCVFANRYFRKEDSLVLSASVDGKPTETVEISLSQMKIVQSRGLKNEPSVYHMKIINLVKRNMHIIRKIYIENDERGIA